MPHFLCFYLLFSQSFMSFYFIYITFIYFSSLDLCPSNLKNDDDREFEKVSIISYKNCVFVLFACFFFSFVCLFVCLLIYLFLYSYMFFLDGKLSIYLKLIFSKRMKVFRLYFFHFIFLFFIFYFYFYFLLFNFFFNFFVISVFRIFKVGISRSKVSPCLSN